MGFLTETLVDEYNEVHNGQFFHDIINKIVVPMMHNKVNILEQNSQLRSSEINSIKECIENLDRDFPYGYVSCYPKHFFSTILEEMDRIEQYTFHAYKSPSYKINFLTEMFVYEHGEMHNEQFFHDIVTKILVPILHDKINTLEQTGQLSTKNIYTIKEFVVNFDRDFPYYYVFSYPKHFFSTLIENMDKIEQCVEFS